MDPSTGCKSCEVGTYSSGGTVSSCVSCPGGKSVAAGQGSSETDCFWSKCNKSMIHFAITLAKNHRALRVQSIIIYKGHNKVAPKYTGIYYIQLIVLFHSKREGYSIMEDLCSLPRSLRRWQVPRPSKRMYTMCTRNIQPWRNYFVVFELSCSENSGSW